MPSATATATTTQHDDDGHEEAARHLSEELAAARTDDERHRLRDELVLCAIGTADALAHRFRDRGVEVDDLEQVARTALVCASQRYDPDVGSGFLAYAVPSITGELKRYFRDHTWAVRPPRRLQELRLAANASREDLRHRLRREPTTDELADELGVPVGEVHEVRCSSAGYRTASLDQPSASGGTVGDHLGVPGDAAASVDTHLALLHALEDLSDRERTLLRLRFSDELTQREIGLRLGVSQMQVSRLLTAVLARLRPVVLAEAS